MEEVPQFWDSPDDAETFALRGGVVLLFSSASSAPVCDRAKQFTRFLLEEGTPDFIGTCVNGDDEIRLAFGTASTGGLNIALRRSSNVATAASVGGGRSGAISALVRAFRGCARLAKPLTTRR